MGQLKDEQVGNVRLYEIVDSVSDLALSFSSRNISLTKYIKDINKGLLKNINIQPAATGTNGTATVAITGTPIVGTLYYVTVIVNQQDSGHTKHYKFQKVSSSATANTLETEFNEVIQAHKDYATFPFTSAITGNDLVFTEAPPAGYVAGEVTILEVKCSITATITLASHVDPFGKGTTLGRIATIAGTSFKGTPAAATDYTTISIDYWAENNKGIPFAKGNEPMTRDIIYISESTSEITAAHYANIITALNELQKLCKVGGRGTEVGTFNTDVWGWESMESIIETATEGYVVHNYRVTNLIVNTTLGAIAGGANLALGKLLYTFPAGRISVKGASWVINLNEADGNITIDTPDAGLGTVLASGVQALLSAVGATSEDILTGQTINDCNGTNETTYDMLASALTIEPTGVHTVYFNVADGWAAGGEAACALAGTIKIYWEFIR